jgi:hypothetical protein
MVLPYTFPTFLFIVTFSGITTAHPWEVSCGALVKKQAATGVITFHRTTPTIPEGTVTCSMYYLFTACFYQGILSKRRIPLLDNCQCSYK